MTGHGRGLAELGSRHVTVEIRAVNHRFFEIKLRGQLLDARAEDAVTRAVRKRAERGAFSVAVREEGGGGRGAFNVDLENAKLVHAVLGATRAALGIAEAVPLALVLAQSGVVSTADVEVDPEVALAALVPAVDAALDELYAMRRVEGLALAADLEARLARIEQLATEVTALAAAAPVDHAARLNERIAKLLATAGVTVDPTRLATEVALFADRIDVSEELVRLASHIAQMRGLIALDAPVGRRLEFLVQELGREINTIGSKSQSGEIARRVVEAKAELEKIREQVQNVE